LNYICHFTVLRKKIVDEIGGFRSKYDGAQDYDLFLRFVEKTNNIHHISKILYHWRCSKTSTSLDYNNKSYTLVNGKLAIMDALKRRNIKADVLVREDIGRYIIDYKVLKEPKISIIIPTKDRSNILDTCLKSIYNKTDYSNFEVIVIDNNSSEDSLFELLDDYKEKYSNFYSYGYECEFNYSYLNNEGIKHSTGDYIVLLNNDTEVITESWLKTMVGYASQSHIGCVGVKLLYPTNNIQHAGVIVGMGGVASHMYLNSPEFESGYYDRLQVPYDVKMVTAACLMVKRSIFDEVDGLDENLKVAYNDVDFNVRVRYKGYYNIFLPQVVLHHYESLSRGSDLDIEKINRFKKEIKYIVDKLGSNLEHDEFYNVNLSKDYWFALERKGK
ncbi:MAG TPA: glycosyltransferase family 2 protein, partial [Bacilli bacterium]|nr:glycosyltransferase family 2 protein [Bacilli bacterium]